MAEVQETKTQSTNNAGAVITWIEKLAAIIEKYGLKKIAYAMILLFMAIILGMFAFAPEVFVEKVEKAQEKAHATAVVKRIKAEPEVRSTLTDLRKDAMASRVFILETHNGGTNFANLPFLYVDLTYAEPSASLSWLESEYKNVRLSRYPFATRLFEDSYWMGTVDDLKEFDEELYLRLSKEGVKYMGTVMIYGQHLPSGVLGIIYTEDDEIPSPSVVKKMLIKYASPISALINND